MYFFKVINIVLKLSSINECDFVAQNVNNQIINKITL